LGNGCWLLVGATRHGVKRNRRRRPIGQRTIASEPTRGRLGIMGGVASWVEWLQLSCHSRSVTRRCAASAVAFEHPQSGHAVRLERLRLSPRLASVVIVTVIFTLLVIYLVIFKLHKPLTRSFSSFSFRLFSGCRWLVWVTGKRVFLVF
jgi:hypothetical protein